LSAFLVGALGGVYFHPKHHFFSNPTAQALAMKACSLHGALFWSRFIAQAEIAAAHAHFWWLSGLSSASCIFHLLTQASKVNRFTHKVIITNELRSASCTGYDAFRGSLCFLPFRSSHASALLGQFLIRHCAENGNQTQSSMVSGVGVAGALLAGHQAGAIPSCSRNEIKKQIPIRLRSLRFLRSGRAFDFLRRGDLLSGG
jgi:hypothetical protein